MKIVYLGSPEISAQLLSALSAEHEIAAVVSNPDKPRKRSGTPEPTAVSALALERGWTLYRPATLKNGELMDELEGLHADVFFVFSYGRILPEALFNLPRFKTLNLHGSILPLLRGASPIQSALLAGMTETGWTLQKITKELDAGDILGEVRVPIDLMDRTLELTEKMMPPAIELSLRVLANLPEALAKAVPQDHSKATFCTKITREDAKLDFSLPAGLLHNRIRAYFPSPGAWGLLSGKNCRILRTRPVEIHSPAGTAGEIWTDKDKMYVQCGQGALEVLELQLEGKKPLEARDFLRGFRPQNARFD